ncbi:MAG: LemA family protein [Candidatus Peregrinibacteria bacterium]|nr:LemA family protein [Candidatus Peregrinibacteria bacterium]
MNNLLIVLGAMIFLIILWMLTYRNILQHYKSEISKSESDLKQKFFIVFNRIPYLLEVMSEYKVFMSHNGAEILEMRTTLIDSELKIEDAFEIYVKLYTYVEEVFATDGSQFKSDVGFLEILYELQDMHDEIRLIVKEYNGSAVGFNEKLLKFPGNFVGGLFNMQSLRTL